MGRLVVARLRRHWSPSHIAFAIGALVLASLAHVHLHLQVIQAGYAIAHESHLRHDLEDQNQKLRLELAMRRDPSVIERRAREELKMTPPDPGAIRVLHANPDAAEARAASVAVPVPLDVPVAVPPAALSPMPSPAAHGAHP